MKRFLFVLSLCMLISKFLFSQIVVAPSFFNWWTPSHSSAMLEVRDTIRGILIPRMTQSQRNAIDTPATGLLVFQINSDDGFYYYTGTSWSRIGVHTGHYIGEPHGGGIIFHLDATGEHGLIVSMVDLSTSQTWSNIIAILIGVTAQSSWNGPGNSLAIVTQQGHTSSAAQLCLDYVNAGNGTGIFDNWHLMSIGEAMHLMNNLYEVQKALEIDGNPATTPLTEDELYWTSMENSDTTAWGCGIGGGGSGGLVIFKSEPLFVRAVRTF